MRKSIEYYDIKIAKLKATIKRLIAEKRLAILYQREKHIGSKGGYNVS
jgi:hypothetical protein